MAIFHLSVKTISRSAGRSATASAAYRSGERILDERTDQVHDYRRKGGVLYTEILLPEQAPEWASDRAQLWNAAEQAETRKNATVAREFEVALPEELPASERIRLVQDFSKALVAQHGCAADIAIHAPGREGDSRNHHAHILLTTRRLEPTGFTTKTRELDDRKAGCQHVQDWRAYFAQLQNERLEQHGSSARVDHRSLSAQGVAREPTWHQGPAISGYERRTGKMSRIRQLRRMVEQVPVVVAAHKGFIRVGQAYQEQLTQETQARQDRQSWRTQHPGRARLHDAKLWRSKELERLQQIETLARRDRQKLIPQYLESARALKGYRRDAERLLKAELLKRYRAGNKQQMLERNHSARALPKDLPKER